MFDEVDHFQNCRRVQSITKRGVLRVAPGEASRGQINVVANWWQLETYMRDAMQTASGCEQLRSHCSMLERTGDPVAKPHC